MKAVLTCPLSREGLAPYPDRTEPHLAELREEEQMYLSILDWGLYLWEVERKPRH